MNNLPIRELSGPPILQQIQKDVEDLKKKQRAMELQTSPTVQVKPTAIGTTLEVRKDQTTQTPAPRTWHP